MSKSNGQRRITIEEPLDQYLKDLSALPTLTLKEEVELARLTQRGDREALHRLVEGNLRFVVYMAARYRNTRVPLLDLINEGNIGLIKAAEKFLPNKGVKFVNYAAWWVVDAIKYALAKQSGVIGLPVNHLKVTYKINRKEVELSMQLGRYPTRDETARALDFTPQHIEANLMAVRTPLFLDGSISEDSDISYINTLKSDCDVEESFMAMNLRAEIKSLLETLSEREREVISMRFGLNGNKQMSLREIEKIMDLSKESIRQVEEKAIKKLQRTVKERRLGALLS